MHWFSWGEEKKRCKSKHVKEDANKNQLIDIIRNVVIFVFETEYRKFILYLDYCL